MNTKSKQWNWEREKARRSALAVLVWEGRRKNLSWQAIGDAVGRTKWTVQCIFSREVRRMKTTQPNFPGILSDGSNAPENTDEARLKFIGRKLKPVYRHSKSGIKATTVPGFWQSSVRSAIDAAMETERREIRAAGGNPAW